jgi:hypothetical protein
MQFCLQIELLFVIYANLQNSNTLTNLCIPNSSLHRDALTAEDNQK